MLQGAKGPYENQSASLQGQRQEGHHHLSKLALGFNSVSPCWVPRPCPSPLCYLLPTWLSQGVGKKFRDRCHFRQHTHILDEHYNNVKALDALNLELFQLQMGEKETVLEWGCIC